MLHYHDPANELVQSLHNRMPAILSPDDYAMWLDDDADLKALHALLKPHPAELRAVSAASIASSTTGSVGGGRVVVEVDGSHAITPAVRPGGRH